MPGKSLGVALLITLAELPSGAPSASIRLDGRHLPSRVEGKQVFTCGGTRATVRYSQERKPLETVDGDPERALSVILRDLRVSGRNIPLPGLKAAEELFSSLAWIESISAECYEETVTLTLRGMPLREWGDFVTEKRDQKPRSPLRTITVGAKGEVTIR